MQNISSQLPAVRPAAVLRQALRQVGSRLLFPPRLQALYAHLQTQPQVPLWRGLLHALQVHYDVQGDAHLPARGAAVVVANHPYGLLEGAIGLDLLQTRRADVRLLINHRLVQWVPELQPVSICIDPFGGPRARAFNRHGMQQAQAFLQAGGMLMLFPAGEVASFQQPWRLRQAPLTDAAQTWGTLCDPAWQRTAVHLAQGSQAPLVPMFFAGSNSLLFHALGLLHPRLRTLRLLAELANKQQSLVTLRVGRALSPTVLQHINARQGTAYARLRTYELQAPHPALRRVAPPVPPAPLASLAPRHAASLQAEIAAIAPADRLYRNADFEVLLVAGKTPPHIMQALGVAREQTFRAIGAGCGAPLDLDAFDRTYQHLLLWHTASQSLAGAYRVGLVQALLRAGGMAQLYSNTLFRYQAAFFDALGPALELGRSFIVPQFQRQLTALPALWHGIGQLLQRYPDVTNLMGTVSMSNAFKPWSRALTMAFFQRLAANDARRAWVRARQPLTRRLLGLSRHASACVQALISSLAPSDNSAAKLLTLCRLIEDLEDDGKSLPVLLRQYHKLGGVILAFNLDRHFADTLDGLVLVDLRRAPANHLRRYMGEAGYRRFEQQHGSALPLQFH